jgi:hypothetical protein
MAKSTWYKVKNGKAVTIKKPKSIDKLLDAGYSVTEYVEEMVDGITKGVIKTFSPMTRIQAWEKHKKRGIRQMRF